MMPQKLHPIQDERAAEKAVDLFIAGCEPLLYASDLGATPEQVYDTLRVALRHCRDNHARPTAGRKPVGKRAKTRAEIQAAYRARQPKKKKQS